MSSAAAARQHKGLGKALGNILLQSQRAWDCGSGGIKESQKAQGSLAAPLTAALGHLAATGSFFHRFLLTVV